MINSHVSLRNLDLERRETGGSILDDDSIEYSERRSSLETTPVGHV